MIFFLEAFDEGFAGVGKILVSIWDDIVELLFGNRFICRSSNCDGEELSNHIYVYKSD